MLNWKKIVYNVKFFILRIVILWYKFFNFPISMSLLKYFNNEEHVPVQLYRNDEVEKNYIKSFPYHNDFMEILFDKEDIFAFRANDYPYYLEQKIAHYVLWIHPSISLHVSDSHDIIKSYLLKHANKYKSYVLFKNSESSKSIKFIDHIHVFVSF